MYGSYGTGLLLQLLNFMVLGTRAVFLRSQRVGNNLLFVACLASTAQQHPAFRKCQHLAGSFLFIFPSNQGYLVNLFCFVSFSFFLPTPPSKYDMLHC